MVSLNLSLAKLYPVGSIYLSVNDTDPGTFIGGTWELVGSGKTLWGADVSHAAGTTIDAFSMYGLSAFALSSILVLIITPPHPSDTWRPYNRPHKMSPVAVQPVFQLLRRL